MRAAALLGTIILALTSTALAKDMSSRLGVGYSDSFSVSNMPSIAVKYYPNQDLSLSAALGIDTNSTNSTSGNSNFGFGVKLYKTIFPEENMNFYMGAGAGLVSISPTTGGSGSTNSGFELSGFFGAEFFLPGLDSMGINFQAGVGVTSLSSGVRFRTIGEHPLKAGLYFYF
ncbi:MAG: organic solvent tolerance protein [Oligoflexia bacterium]|nr:organic solvent tolerance protein [Oligoflexia bacterium]